MRIDAKKTLGPEHVILSSDVGTSPIHTAGWKTSLTVLYPAKTQPACWASVDHTEVNSNGTGLKHKV